MNQLEAQAQHLQDQARESLKEWRNTIEALSTLQPLCPLSELEAACVRKVCHIVIGDMILRECEAKVGE